MEAFKHRAKSWKQLPVPKDLRQWKWHFYDNDGSYNGWFDWLPRRLRVGPWSPFAWTFLVAWFLSLCAYRPDEELKVSAPASWSAWWWWDVLLGFWGVVVLVFCKVKHGMGPILTSYTMWSWTLLTVHASCASAGALLSGTSIGRVLLLASEFTRFPAVVGANVTWWLWNFILFPLIYMFAFTAEDAKHKFFKFNFGFFLTNVHMLNLPAVVMTSCLGGRGGGVRHLDHTDLWCGLLVAFAYALLYLLVLDRAGIHFYPIFSPRTHLCALSYTALLIIYLGCWRFWNMLIDYFNGP
eukprot:TRINITY_DN50391_c0_g1_i1.p1 TRINITY_DN50391_c0_g1~~TRINITY_DN50391_c0_g1_i1.p1  ORF type:complete len:303 (+),score=35.86 TRINITY_DN50391_c0_g1_i1:22-909(+)